MTEIDHAQTSDENESLPVAEVSPFTIVAYITLLADAYLVLASLATKMMNRAYASYLLPFGGGNNAGETHFWALIVATWTGTLAVGCLSSRDPSSRGKHGAAIVWFLLVIALGALGLITAGLRSGVSSGLSWAKELFLYGP